jgi:hypothetical protein
MMQEEQNINSEGMKQQVEQLIASINKRRTFWELFKESHFIGKQPILICIFDQENPQRAKKWSRSLAKHTNAHVMAISSNYYSLEIKEYIENHQIHSFFFLEITDNSTDIHISSSEESLISFIKNSLVVEPVLTFSHEAENLPIYEHAVTTFLKVGISADLVTFFTFLLSFIHIPSKVSLEDKQSAILTKSSLAVAQNIPYNRVELHPDFLQKFQLKENDYVIVYNPLKFIYTVASVKRTSKKMSQEEIITSLGIKNKLEMDSDSKVVLHPLKKIIATDIQLQDVKSLAEGNIFVSPDLYKKIMAAKTDCFEVFNRTTAASFDISKTNIIESTSMSPSSIKMSYLQREFLDFEHPPDTLSPYYYGQYHNLDKLDLDQLLFLKKQYANGKVNEISDYEEKLEIKRILKKVDYNQVVLYPLYRRQERKKNHLLIRFYHYLLELFIRSASLKLKVIRPYSTDESSNIVRMSKSAMSLLGIAENDLIWLHYRKQSIAVPVLEFDQTELIKEVNIVTNESAINISIGIPAHLRYQLGIKQIGKICEVERNMSFLFIKNVHLQFLPVLASVFAIFSFDHLKAWIQLLMTIGIIPLSMYITLSAVRAKIPKQIRQSNKTNR